MVSSLLASSLASELGTKYTLFAGAVARDVEPGSSALPEDILDACLFYAGQYELHPSEVRHFVTEATDPHRIGQTLIR